MADEAGNEIKLEDVVKQVSDLADVVTKMTSTQQTMQEGLSSITNALSEGLLSGGKTGEEDKKKQPEISADDLENMSRAELVQHTVQSVLGALDGVIDPLKQEVDSVKQTTQKSSVARDIERARSAYKDFDKWGEEMVAVAETTPGISVERAYKLARLENPDKAAEMDKEFGLVEEKGEEDKKDTPKFFALNPSGTADFGDDEDSGANDSDIRKALKKNLDSVLSDMDE
jgi:hypothetical protein